MCFVFWIFKSCARVSFLWFDFFLFFLNNEIQLNWFQQKGAGVGEFSVEGTGGAPEVQNEQCRWTENFQLLVTWRTWVLPPPMCCFVILEPYLSFLYLLEIQCLFVKKKAFSCIEEFFTLFIFWWEKWFFFSQIWFWWNSSTPSAWQLNEKNQLFAQP